MAYSIKEIAAALGAEARGAVSLNVSGVNEPALCGPDDLALAMAPDFAAAIPEGRARAALLWADADWQALGLEAAILAPRPRYALAGLSAMMDQGQGHAQGIHPSAVIDESAELGEGVSVGPFSVIGPRAKIGAGSVIGPQVFVGRDVVLGEAAMIREGVKIGADSRIGARFIAQPGAAVGGDGFSFVTPEASAAETARATLGETETGEGQPWARIHSLGGVEIGDDVELGANSCIDRGTVRATRVGDGTKIDNLVQVGHNVVVGRHCMLCAQVGVAGSSSIGDFTILGGQTGVGDNLRVGARVVTGGATKVLANIPDGRIMLGYPAMQMKSHIEAYKGLRRLPRLFADVASLKKAVFKPGESD